MTLSDALSAFDDPWTKSFDLHNVTAALSTLDDEQKKSSWYHYEMLAFSLVNAHGDSPWDTYYGPQFTFFDASGNDVYSPALEDITVEVIDYWQIRMRETNNPLLKMHYAGHVWDFETKVAKRKHSSELYTTYVNAMLSVCNGDYCSHPTLTVNVLERLFQIAKGNTEFLQKTKEAYDQFETKYVTDDGVCYWASRFRLMLDNRNYFTEKEQHDIVYAHESRLKRLVRHDAKSNINPWIVQSQVELLADYYKSINSLDNLKRVLNIEEQTFLQTEASMPAVQLLGNLIQMHKKFIHYGMQSEATRLSVVIQRLGKKVIDDIEPEQIKLDIQQEAFDEIERWFGDNTDSDIVRWKKFCSYFIPKLSDEKVSLKRFSTKHPFEFFMETHLTDYKGRPMSVIGS